MCEGGTEGQKRVRAHPADVVICDIFMPEKDGLEVTKELLSEFQSAKIITISGRARARKFDMLRVAKKFGAVGAITKPIDFEELLAAVREALEGE
jgi:DNA-binding NarL/FixJ family response regulator